MSKKESVKKTKDAYEFVGESLMRVNGMTCELNMPVALKGGNVHVLPPYNRVPAFAVDEYPACPDNWMHGSSKASSYFVPVRENRGMWLDFNPNEYSRYHIAVVLSIQGVNPVTGQKTDVMRLEQYKNKCPVHDVDFKQDRFCDECGFKWPAQNYISSTGTPSGQLWLDGFRTPEGNVRQYFFTEEEIKSIAAQVLGDDRVFAIGIAFYLSKETKPMPKPVTRGVMEEVNTGSPYLGGPIGPPSAATGYFPTKGGSKKALGPVQTQDWTNTSDGLYAADDIQVLSGDEAKAKRPELYQDIVDGSKDRTLYMLAPRSRKDGEERFYTLNGSLDPVGINHLEVEQVEPTKTLEIGAGALIDQEVHPDPESVDFWQEEPVGFVYVNYVDEETASNIIEAGKRPEKADGFMENLQVGVEA